MDVQMAQLLDALGSFACTLPLVWGHVRLAPMRRPGTYLAVAIAINLAYAFARSSLPFWSHLVDIVVDLVLAFSFYDAPYGYRAFVALVALVPPLACEALGFILWLLVSGATQVSTGDALARPGTVLLVRTLFLAVELALYEVLVRFVSATLGARRPTLAGRAALLPAAQLPVVLALLYFVMFSEQDQAGCALLVAVFVSLCLVVDFAAVLGLERAARAAAARERSRILATQIDEVLAAYDEFSEQAEAAARLRHDVRNHLQTAEALAARGDVERARDYLLAVREEARR